MLPAKKRIKLLIAAIGVIAMALLALVLLGASPLPKAQAAAPARAGARLYLPSDVFTDTYEVNDAQPSAYFLGTYNQVPCSSGTGAQIINSATFWRSGLSNPATDVDWYRITLGSQYQYTFTVNQQASSDLEFTISVLDTSNNVIYSQSNLSDATIPFYSYTGGSFYIQLAASNASAISGSENKTYQVFLCSSATNVTATPSPQPPTLTPAGLSPDNYEPNDTLAEAAIATGTTRTTASFIAVGQRIDNLSFTPYTGRTNDAADWFQFYGRSRSIYQITTLNVQPGVETILYVYKIVPPSQYDNPPLVLVPPLSGYTNPNNRFEAGVRGSQVTFQIPSNSDGLYWIKVVNADPSPRVPGQTYSLQVQEILQAATPGPSPTVTAPGPTGTPFPGAVDKYEYNGDFDHAYLVAPNVTYDNINFVPWQPYSLDDVNNDFFKLPVKQGIFYTCQTLNLAPGTDTNLIVYNQDHVGIGGNDDISPDERSKGNFASRFSWLSSYTGWAYALVGPVNPPKANEAGSTGYSLRCDIGLPVTQTPTGTLTANTNPGPTFVPPTPQPPEPTMTPFPTPRTAQNLPVRPINVASPTPTPAPLVTPRAVTLGTQVFIDANSNGVLDPGEGISGVSVRLSDEQSGVPLAQAMTDADGRLNITVVNPGPVRLSVPLFGYSLLVMDETSTVRIAVASTLLLPDRIP